METKPYFVKIEEMLTIFLKVRNRERDMLHRLFLVVTNELVTIDARYQIYKICRTETKC